MEDNKNIEERDSNHSFFNESFSVEEVLKKNQNESSDPKILRFAERFLKKKRRVLTEEEKKERIQKNIDRYCKRNEEMLSLLEKIDSGETTHKNINRTMRLLPIDLSDTRKLINKKALIYNQKREIFNRLLEFTYEDYQYFWYQLTDGKFKKGKAQLIKSSNISKAKEILRQIEEKNKNNINNNQNENNINNNVDNNNADNNNSNNVDKKNEEENNKKKDTRTVKEIIQAATLRDIENERMDKEFFENSDISSEDSLSSSLEDSEDDDEINSNSKSSNKDSNKEKEDKELKAKKEKEEKEKKEKEEKEKAEREKKEKEERERKLKMLMEDEDEIDIFN